MNYEFLVETYETERIKVLSVWSEFKEEDLPVRPRPSDPRGRSVREQMVHQCVSEDLWFRTMLGIDVGAPPLPAQETRLEFVKRYAQDSGKRVAALGAQDDSCVDLGGSVQRHVQRRCERTLRLHVTGRGDLDLGYRELQSRRALRLAADAFVGPVKGNRAEVDIGDQQLFLE